MLNELASILRGLTNAGLTVTSAHPNVQAVGATKAPLLVRVDSSGALKGIELFQPELLPRLWTFRDGKHNSFPLVPLPPLIDLTNPERDYFNKTWKAASPVDRRKSLSKAAINHPRGTQWLGKWPGKALFTSLRAKGAKLASIEPEAAALPEIINRFLTIFDASTSKPAQALVNEIIEALLTELQSGLSDWLEPARATLVGDIRPDHGKVTGGNLYFDVAAGQFDRDVHDSRNQISAANALAASSTTRVGRCAITGTSTQLHSGNFPQANLPALGLSYLFSKNPDLMAAGSYGRFADNSFPVGKTMVGEMAGALMELVDRTREKVTWCTVPGERRNASDLLIAYVEGAPETPVTTLLFEGVANETHENNDLPDPIALYELRTERLITTVSAGQANEALRQMPLQVCLLRKVDEGNRKVLFHRRLTIGQLHDCARLWISGQQNLPEWLTVHKQGKSRPRSLTPLSLPLLTKRQFIRGGRESVDAIGLPATTAFSFFLGEGDRRRLARRFLRIVLRRHTPLLVAVAHIKHGGRDATLDTATGQRILGLLGILLEALDRKGQPWMNDTAFHLGQLLSVADVIHAGYCADMRQGRIPPTLLGNAVLTLAQANPAKALAILARRWKPYASWAKRANSVEAQKLRSSEKGEDKSRGWRILQAISQHRRLTEISAHLHNQLPKTADDVFRAELLLGYLAGLPPKPSTYSQSGEKSMEDTNGDA